MAIELITGRAGAPHVDSADVGAFNAAMFGDGAYVLDGINAELVDANNVTVSAGEMLCEGRHIRITGAGEALTIDNGTSAYKRHDIIAAHYLRDEDGMESVALVVVKGTPSIDTPTDPAMPTTGKLIDGASEVYWPLFRVTIDGLTPQAPVLIAQRQALHQLGLGTEIPAGANLNDYKTPGVFRVASNNNALNIGNVPNLSGGVGAGRLIVSFTWTDLNDEWGSVTQEYEESNGATYYRWYNSHNGTWSAWSCNGGIDAPIAEGTTNGWYWKKWASGWAELSIRYLVQNVEGTGHKNVSPPAFPFTIVSNFVANGNASFSGQAGSYLQYLRGYEEGGPVTRLSAFISKHVATTGTVYCYYTVSGKWK